MTSQRKWGIIVGGLFATLLLGFVIPGLWIIYLIVVLVVIFTPSTNPHQTASVQAVTTETSDARIASIVEAIKDRIDQTDDEKVRAGLNEALQIVDTLDGGQFFTNDDRQLTDQESALHVPPAPIIAELSPEELRAEKEKQDEKNTNTILYLASFLLVGAAVLFIGTSLDPTAKFVGLLLITFAFYGTGIFLYKKYEKLHPAATAFVGTGVALVPFVGLAMYNYVLPDGHFSWFLTSLVGLCMYLYATLLLRKQILAYLSTAFIFSLTTSAISILSVPFVWYFVTIILTGSLLGYIAYKKPAWLPSELHTPLEQNGQLATPLAIIGSLFLGDRLSLFDYEIIIGVSTIYYLVMALGLSTKEKLLYWSAGRLGLLTLILLGTYDLTSDMFWIGVVLSVSAFVSYLYSSRHLSQLYENVWMVYPQVALLAGIGLWLGDWTNISIGLLLIVCMSTLQLILTKQTVYGAGLVAGLLLLPSTLLYGVFKYDASTEAVAAFAIFAACCFLMARYGLQNGSKAYTEISTILYMLFIVDASLFAALTTQPGWIASITLIASCLLFAATFVERANALLMIANVFFVYGLWNALTFYGYDNEWQWLVTGWIAAGLWYALRFYYGNSQFSSHRDIMLGSTLTALLIAAFLSAFDPSTAVAAALTGCVVAGIIAYEGYIVRNTAYYEIALFVLTMSLQRLIVIEYPDTNWLVFTHWWAGIIGITALLRKGRGQSEDARSRGILALLVLSVPTGLAALGDPESYQLLFLLEHVVLAVAGFVTNKKLVLQWGVVGIVLALIKLLSGYTYVLLFLLAIGLIALAVWRLLKKQS